MRMKLAFAAALLLSGVSAASAADNWAGAWGFVALPLPAGQAPAPIVPGAARLATLVPMSEAPPIPAPPAGRGGAPLLENPGNIALLPGNVDLTKVTVRELVRVSLAGSQIRLRFSNEASPDVLPLGAVHVAEAGPDGSIVPGSDHVVTFDGRRGVTIPASSPLLSDPVNMPVRAMERLLISIHVPGAVPRTGHALFTYVTQTPGDNTAAAALPDVRLARVTALVTEVDVNTATPAGVIAALGDSITEGATSTSNAFRSWPDRLAERLSASAATRDWTVVNAGIGSNRLLHDTPSTNALSRFDRDVLSVPRVKAVIVLLGINDIQYSNRNAAEAVHAPEEIAAFRQLIDRAHAAGLKIYGATITPFEGSPDYTAEGEADRQAMNSFIRSGTFDGVVDFDAALRDPARPTHLKSDVESSGHLHPNDAGYRVMGDSIDLKLFK